jgi:integrase
VQISESRLHADFRSSLWQRGGNTLILSVESGPITKNVKAHTVCLSDFALPHFERLHAITGATQWVFPNSKLDRPPVPKTVTKKLLTVNANLMGNS